MAKTPEEVFAEERSQDIDRQGADDHVRELANLLLVDTAPYKYSYNFRWMGRPIIQLPQDMVAMQEIIWEVRPDLIIETGVAHGGSLVFYASLLELIGEGEVLGIDIDIRKHNRLALEAHPMYKRIRLLEGGSTDSEVIAAVREITKNKQRILVCLDSNHTHEHVLAELELYAPLVTLGSYCVVFDTVVEYMPDSLFPDRPWGIGNNPMTALHAWLPDHPEFMIDRKLDNKLLLSVAPSGYLKRIA